MNTVREPTTLEELLARHAKPAELYWRLEKNRVQCHACGHLCKIPEGRAGVCKVRFNRGGELMAPAGYVGALNCDPIEKKPFFHVLPGSFAYSFGMLGCDYHCSYCQNWITSQVIRDKNANGRFQPITAREMIQQALRLGARTVTSTYNEPLITSEWAVEVFKEAKGHGLRTSYVSNGNGTPEVLDYIRPWTDFYKIDLKSFQDRNYRKLGGTLEAVLNTIRLVREKGFWLEVVTLVVPGLNDQESELRDIARFLASVDVNVPWHITAFHEDYKMRGMGNTQAAALLRGAEIGKEEELKFVYIGNVRGHCREWEHTWCPDCGALLIERDGFRIVSNHIREGMCHRCGAAIPGVWS